MEYEVFTINSYLDLHKLSQDFGKYQKISLAGLPYTVRKNRNGELYYNLYQSTCLTLGDTVYLYPKTKKPNTQNHINSNVVGLSKPKGK